MVKLEDKPDMAVADLGQFGFTADAKVDSLKEDFPFRGSIQGPENMQEGAFPGP